jgi:endonuclease G
VQAREASREKMRWEEDPLVKTGSARFEDFRKFGFDKGHLAPAADMRWSQAAMRESFLLSNASPQRHEFNAGVWEEIENAVRNFAVQHQAVYVVTGPVLRKGLPTIGPDKVSIPEYFYKAILVLSGDTCEAIGFVCRNEPSDLPIERFAVSIDSVEALTGLDFFNALPDNIENRAERKTDVKWWLPKKGKLPRR